MSERKDLNFSELDPNWTNTPGFGVLNCSLEDFYQRTNRAWQRLGFEFPPIPERNRGYGRVKQKMGPFKANFYPHFNHPWSRINFSGWDVELNKHGVKEQVDIRIDIQGNLQQLRITKPLEVEPTYRRLDDLFTEARFSRGRLHCFWQEEPNGTFFPDPRGGTDQIWPFWLNMDLTENPRHFWRKINTRDGTLHVSKNPAHYHPLDNFETAERLSSWGLPF